MKVMNRMNGMPLADKVFWFVVFMILGWILWLKFVKPFGEIYEWLYLVVGPVISYLIVRTLNNYGAKKKFKKEQHIKNY